jgi:hypothetical protein
MRMVTRQVATSHLLGKWAWLGVQNSGNPRRKTRAVQHPIYARQAELEASILAAFLA